MTKISYPYLFNVCNIVTVSTTEASWECEWYHARIMEQLCEWWWQSTFEGMRLALNYIFTETSFVSTRKFFLHWVIYSTTFFLYNCFTWEINIRWIYIYDLIFKCFDLYVKNTEKDDFWPCWINLAEWCLWYYLTWTASQ